MKKIEYVCDRCKKPVNKIPRLQKIGLPTKVKRSPIAIFRDWLIEDPYDQRSFNEIDLCKDCRADLDRWLGDACHD